MSFIHVVGLEDTEEFVMGFWARVPTSSAEKVHANSNPDDPMSDILPLVVMGKAGQKDAEVATNHETATFTVTGYSSAGTDSTFSIDSVTSLNPPIDSKFHVEGHSDINTGAYWQAGTDHTTEDYITTSAGPPGKKTIPTVIGVDCSDITKPLLYVNLETAKKGKVTGYAFDKIISAGEAESIPGVEVFYSGTRTFSYDTLPFGLLVSVDGAVAWNGDVEPSQQPDGSGTPRKVDYEDRSSLWLTGTGALEGTNIPFELDKWHIIIISAKLSTIATHGAPSPFDISAPLSSFVDATSQLYVSLDDVNYTGNDLSGDNVDGKGPNNIINRNALNVAGSVPPTDEDLNVLAVAAYVLDSPNLPLSGGPMGIPATSSFVDNIFEVEFGPFQFFSGISMDTASVAMRRAFVKEPDKNGVQRPANRRAAEKFFDQKPTVKFFRKGQWEKAKIAGEIDAYRPAPNLGGDQGE